MEKFTIFKATKIVNEYDGFIALGESKFDSANIIFVLLMSKSLMILEDWLHKENL